MLQPIRLLVCGPRDATCDAYVWSMLSSFTDKYGFPEILINGGAPGVDQAARNWAKFHDIPVETFHAQWTAYGRSAGPRRNTTMLSDGKPNVVIAFVYPNRKTPGTADMIRQARNGDVKVFEIPIR